MTAKKDTLQIQKASPVKSTAKAKTAPVKAGAAKPEPETRRTDAENLKNPAAKAQAGAAPAKSAPKPDANKVATTAAAKTAVKASAKIPQGGANAKTAAADAKPAARAVEPAASAAAAKTTAPVKPAEDANGAEDAAQADAASSIHDEGALRKPFAGSGKKFKPPVMLAPHFSDKELKEFRARLLELHRQLVNSVNSQLGDALPIADKINVDEDGTEAFDRVVGLEQAGKDQYKINKVKEALLALDAGTYGLCQICGGKIAAVRLKALPFAFTCVACQEKIDNPNGEKSRLIDLLD